MKTVGFIFVLLMGCVCNGNAQQDSSYFKKKVSGTALWIYPKWVEGIASTSRSSGFFIDDKYLDSLDKEIKKDYQRLKVNEVIDEKERLMLQFYFNEQGDVFYCKFLLNNQRSFSRLEEERLRAFVMNVLKLKINMKYVTIDYPFRGRFTYGMLVCYPNKLPRPNS